VREKWGRLQGLVPEYRQASNDLAEITKAKQDALDQDAQELADAKRAGKKHPTGNRHFEQWQRDQFNAAKMENALGKECRDELADVVKVVDAERAALVTAAEQADAEYEAKLHKLVEELTEGWQELERAKQTRAWAETFPGRPGYFRYAARKLNLPSLNGNGLGLPEVLAALDQAV
jgi:hypothetical protein